MRKRTSNQVDDATEDRPAISVYGSVLYMQLDPLSLRSSQDINLKGIGVAIIVLGSLFFVYVLLYFRSGFFGETEPRLDFLVTKGPYRFCRHPQYLSFIIMILGLNLVFRSFLGIVFTLALSVPSVAYRAKEEDRLLRSKFGKEQEDYAESRILASKVHDIYETSKKGRIA